MDYKSITCTTPSGVEYKFRFSEITDKNIENLKILNSSIFPIHYKDSFYQQVLKIGSKFSYFGF